jgi:hypothetical protein
MEIRPQDYSGDNNSRSISKAIIKFKSIFNILINFIKRIGTSQR